MSGFFGIRSPPADPADRRSGVASRPLGGVRRRPCPRERVPGRRDQARRHHPTRRDGRSCADRRVGPFRQWRFAPGRLVASGAGPQPGRPRREETVRVGRLSRKPVRTCAVRLSAGPAELLSYPGGCGRRHRMLEPCTVGEPHRSVPRPRSDTQPSPLSVSSSRSVVRPELGALAGIEAALEQRPQDRRVDLRPVQVRRRQHRLDVGTSPAAAPRCRRTDRR